MIKNYILTTAGEQKIFPLKKKKMNLQKFDYFRSLDVSESVFWR